MLTVDVNAHIKGLGNEILNEFKSRAGNVSFTPEEIELISRCANRLAQVAVLSVGADERTRQEITARRNLAIAALANVAVAKGIRVEVELRRAAYAVIQKAIAIALSIAIAA